MNRKRYLYHDKEYTKQELQLMYNKGQLKAIMYDSTELDGILEILAIEDGSIILNYNGSIRVNRLSKLGTGFRFKLDGTWKHIRDFKVYNANSLKGGQE